MRPLLELIGELRYGEAKKDSRGRTRSPGGRGGDNAAPTQSPPGSPGVNTIKGWGDAVALFDGGGEGVVNEKLTKQHERQAQASLHGENLTIALHALIHFIKDDPMPIPDGVLEVAGESPMDGKLADDPTSLVDKRRPRAGGRKTTAAAASAGDGGADAAATAATEAEGSTAPTEVDVQGGGDQERDERIDDANEVLGFDNEEATEVDIAAAKLRTKRAKLVSKEFQRRKTAIEVEDLISLIQSPLCAVVSPFL